ncbi:LPS assembly lipoprotein LptE [Yoonia sp. SS1-5]|uniref:LPS assembly lipoprotein LptE n=1 Tax=Yoonia rhodophyticola TaxID=3137370 RepID=A0AAN0NL01_9RHOB
MSSAVPRRLALLGLLSLAGCGFAPVYGDTSGLRGQVTIDSPESVAGFRLRDRLEQRLGVATQPRYALSVELGSTQRPAAITAEGDTVRFNVVGDADWVLRNGSDGQVIDRGTIQTFTSYAATGSTVATQAAATDAQARLSVALADAIVSRLLVLTADLDG